ncbi:MAG: FAD-dependent oxidoreductase [Planctomycetota bacterium]
MPLSKKYDVIVIGGGTAGTIAAIQAGRAGAKTLLIEKSGGLGGTVTNALVNYPAVFFAWGKQVITGIGWELVKDTNELAGISTPQHPEPVAEKWIHSCPTDPHIFAALSNERLISAGVDMLLHAMPARIKSDPKGHRVTVCVKTGLVEFKATIVIDATGDANATQIAGLPVDYPKETQPATLIFKFNGYDYNSLNLDAIQAAFDQAVESGELIRHDLHWNVQDKMIAPYLRSGGGNCNHVCGINAFDSEGRTRAEIAGRQTLLKLFRFFKRQPGLEKIKVAVCAPECGIRETGIIRGVKTVTLDDYFSGRRWDDAVCNSFYPIDLHIETGKGVDWRALKPGTIPSIPRGSMIPVGSKQFIVAGRCISSDRLANSALRVEASCMAMGQAAGAMAALAVKAGVDVSAVAIDEINDLQRRHGAIVPGDLD